MYRRLEHNARAIFKSTDSGAHYDWVAATRFYELVTKIDWWQDVVFKWIDEMWTDYVSGHPQGVQRLLQNLSLMRLKSLALASDATHGLHVTGVGHGFGSHPWYRGLCQPGTGHGLQPSQTRKPTGFHG
ncbi:hypothetical protein B0H19DRAFT_1077704 [Mycena capillaripes]|nr:hypothetical protein B0H19DRAFT_1077704 [Mycena capillaripes]